MLKKYFTFIFLIILISPALWGLFYPGFPVTDDGDWMIIRFSAFYTALRHGQFPVRFLMQLNHGYGYPVADFLYPLFMYLGVPIHLLGFGFITTIKIILGGSLIASGIFCYLWLRKCFDRRGVLQYAPLAGALCYVLLPYHLFDVYQRGSVGEVLALTIVPFIFWQIEKRSSLCIAIGTALLILAHNSLALLLLPVIILYAGIASSYLLAMTSLLMGLGISAFFWLPALYDKQFTVFDTINVSDFSQYFLTAKNFGVCGIFALLIFIAGMLYILRGKKPACRQARSFAPTTLFFLFVAGTGLFFSLPVSSFLWKFLPLPQLVQFPFRFLSLVTLGIAFLTGYIINQIKPPISIIITIICIGMLYVSSWQYFFPKGYHFYPDTYYTTNQDTTTVKNEYMPRWVKDIPLSSPKQLTEVIAGQATIENLIANNGNTIQFTATVSRSAIIQINTVYFPGWKLFVDNKQHNFSYANTKGVMDVQLEPGKYLVKARFGETPLRIFADIVSLLSVALCLCLMFSI